MAVGRFARVVLIGDRTGTWAGETWQTGISVVAADAGGNFRPAIRQPLPQFAVSEVGETQSTTNYQIDWAWYGQSADGSDFTKTKQIALADAALIFWSTTVAPLNTNAVRLREIRIAAHQYVNGKWSYINGANIFRLNNANLGTASNTATMPPQIALAMSTRTGARGGSGRGRMYLPCNGSAQGGTDGRPLSTILTNVGSGGKTFVQALLAQVDDVAVVSQGSQTYSSITALAVGNAFDVQRRRAEQTAETYTVTVI